MINTRRMKKIFVLVSFLCCLTLSAMGQTTEKLGATPAMGWNSWNKFNCQINQQLIHEIIDAMVSTGLKDAGYQYVNLDDAWHGPRDENGFIQPDAKRFSSGIKALSDYAHSKGLKFGIYTCAGSKTCANYPGSLGHEYQDALQYARWGVDYIKEDWCNTENINAKGAYRVMADAIQQTGRPMYFSLCEWGTNKPWLWAGKFAQSWRTTGDIQNNFKSVLSILDQQQGLRKYAGPGHWNDPDMLEVGNGMPVNEDRAHFSMWCMLAAPLILGNDIRHMSKETAGILMNKDVIAVDQDKLGVEGLRYATDNDLEFWFKPLEGGDWAFCILNRGTAPVKYVLNWQKFNFTDDLSKRATNFDQMVYSIRNLWTKKNEGTSKRTKKVIIPGHDVVMYRLTPKK